MNNNKIFILIIVLFMTGCGYKVKENYRLDEILNGFSFKRSKNSYTLKLEDNNVYKFVFANSDNKKNYFENLINRNSIKYYYVQGRLQINSCTYDIVTKEYCKCNDKEQIKIQQTINNFNLLMNEMKLDINDIDVTINNVSNTIVDVRDI